MYSIAHTDGANANAITPSTAGTSASAHANPLPITNSSHFSAPVSLPLLQNMQSQAAQWVAAPYPPPAGVPQISHVPMPPIPASFSDFIVDASSVQSQLVALPVAREMGLFLTPVQQAKVAKALTAAGPLMGAVKNDTNGRVNSFHFQFTDHSSGNVWTASFIVEKYRAPDQITDCCITENGNRLYASALDLRVHLPTTQGSMAVRIPFAHYPKKLLGERIKLRTTLTTPWRNFQVQQTDAVSASAQCILTHTTSAGRVGRAVLNIDMKQIGAQWEVTKMRVRPAPSAPAQLPVNVSQPLNQSTAPHLNRPMIQSTALPPNQPLLQPITLAPNLALGRPSDIEVTREINDFVAEFTRNHPDFPDLPTPTPARAIRHASSVQRAQDLVSALAKHLRINGYVVAHRNPPMTIYRTQDLARLGPGLVDFERAASAAIQGRFGSPSQGNDRILRHYLSHVIGKHVSRLANGTPIQNALPSISDIRNEASTFAQAMRYAPLPGVVRNPVPTGSTSILASSQYCKVAALWYAMRRAPYLYLDATTNRVTSISMPDQLLRLPDGNKHFLNACKAIWITGTTKQFKYYTFVVDTYRTWLLQKELAKMGAML